MNKIPSVTAITVAVVLAGCGSSGTNTDAGNNAGAETQAVENTVPAQSSPSQSSLARIEAVNFSGEPGNYNFSVTVSSPDTGCNQYADWWEVLTADGELLYRRILAHSHVSEQPFTRSGGPVQIAGNEQVILRAHMNNSGYGSQVYRGTIESGFTESATDSGFAEDLEFVDPLPDDCAF